MESEGGACLNEVTALLDDFSLDTVPTDAWVLLRSAAATSSLDLEVDTHHLSCEKLRGLENALITLQSAGESDMFWDWLAQPADLGSVESSTALSRAQALVLILGQVTLQEVGTTFELQTAAGCAYLALLSLQGAERAWRTLFQPAVFGRVICGLRPLRVERRHHHHAVNAEAIESSKMMEPSAPRTRNMTIHHLCHDVGGVIDEDTQTETQPPKAAIPSAASCNDAFGLLAALVASLRAHSRRHSADVLVLVVGELAPLVIHPTVAERVAQKAAEGLAFVVAGAKGYRETRRAAACVLRAILPALVIAQDKMVSSLPTISKSCQQSRAVALGIVRGIIRGRAAVLLSMPKKEKGKSMDGGANSQHTPSTHSGDECTSDSGDDSPCVPVDGTQQNTHASRGIDNPILAMLQLMCILAPDRAEWRAAAADAVLTLLCDAASAERDMALVGSTEARLVNRPGVHVGACAGNGGQPTVAKFEVVGVKRTSGIVCNFFAFLRLLLQSERASSRVIAVEVAICALERSAALTKPTTSYSREELDAWLLCQLLVRCSDAVPTVRNRALAGISAGLVSVASYPAGQSLLHAAVKEGCIGPQHFSMSQLFTRAATDAKAHSRRASLLFFEASARILHEVMGFESEAIVEHFDSKLLGALALDESVIVRKAAISSLALLLRICPSAPVCALWTQHVLPLVLDVEGSVVDRALEEVEAAVFEPLRKLALALPSRSCSPREKLPPASEPGFPIPIVLDSLDSTALEYLQRAVRCFACRGRKSVLAALVASLAQVIRACLHLPPAVWSPVVWSLLEELAANGAALGAMPPDLVLEAWDCFNSISDASGGAKHGTSALLAVQVLNVLEQVAPGLTRAQAEVLAQSLCKKLSSLALPVEQIGIAMRVVRRLRTSKLVHADNFKAWQASLRQSMEAMLSRHSCEGSATTALHCCVFMVGELGFESAVAVSAGAIAVLSTIATSASSGKASDTALRAHAVVALGKLCLQSDALAKRTIELFVCLLRESEPLAVRSNALVVLGDLCVRYTSLVDRFLPCISDLLRDPLELLRRQCTMVLSSLLSESYIKFRGLLMFRFLYVLCDSASEIRNLVECVFHKILHRRNPSLLPHCFVDVVCTLNGWPGHPNFKGAVGNESFSLHLYPSRRTIIYRFVLSLLTAEHKFLICSQMVTGFLSGFTAVEDARRLQLPRTLNEPAGQALGDILDLLSCKEMRICFSPKLAAEDEEDELDAPPGGSSGTGVAGGGGPANRAGAEAARGALSGMLRQVICENIAPVLVQLKGIMECERSPFLGRIRHCLCEALREFKDELNEMLDGDTQLAEEVAFDLKAGCRGAAVTASAACVQSQPATSAVIGKRLSLGSTMLAGGLPKSGALDVASDLQDVRGPEQSLAPSGAVSVVGSTARQRNGRRAQRQLGITTHLRAVVSDDADGIACPSGKITCETEDERHPLPANRCSTTIARGRASPRKLARQVATPQAAAFPPSSGAPHVAMIARQSRRGTNSGAPRTV